MPKKKTHEEYVSEVAAINPDIEVVGGYKNSRTTIEHRCKKCGNVWHPIPNNILSGKGCPECASSGKKQKTHEQYIDEVSSINSDVDVVGHYDGALTPICHKCKTCGNVWFVRPNDILHGAGCPECAKQKIADKNTKTHEKYVYDVAHINPNIEVIGYYETVKKEIIHKCKTCGNMWYVSPYSILRGCSCPECLEEKRVEKLTKAHNKYVVKVVDVNPDIIVVEEYNGAFTKIDHKCKKCGNVFPARPHSILCGTGCPKCNMSKGEKIIAAWLDKKNIAYKPQETFDDCRDKDVLKFDFHLLDYNILIEYNGIQHYEPVDYFGGQEGFEGTVRRDKIKVEYCKNNNIPLITIPYFADINEELDKLYELVVKKEAIA